MAYLGDPITRPINHGLIDRISHIDNIKERKSLTMQRLGSRSPNWQSVSGKRHTLTKSFSGR